MLLLPLVTRVNQILDRTLRGIKGLLLGDSLSATPAPVHQAFPNLLIERLYYAEGRQHPSHPLHGSYAGLCKSLF